MRTTLTPGRTRRARWLYAGVAIFVLLSAVTARLAWRAWHDRAGQARAAAVFSLVEQRTPARPTDAPGATAWLREQLTAYRAALSGDTASAFARLADQSSTAPGELAAAAVAMREIARAAQAGPRESEPKFETTPLAFDNHSRRSQELITAGDTTLVVTRRRALERDPASNAFVAGLTGPMARSRAQLDSALNGAPPANARIVRLYALSEDGTLLSLPWPAGPGHSDSLDVAHNEARQLASRPALPSFAPEEFFFAFDPDDAGAVRYSGLYLDLGGRGLVSTLMIPIATGGASGVLALDVAHPIDWDRFARALAPPVSAVVVSAEGDDVSSWGDLRRALRDPVPADVASMLEALTATDAPFAAGSPMTHAVVDGVGAIAGFHVTDRDWLLAVFPSSAPSFPWSAIVLLAVLLIALLAGFEFNRRRAEREGDNAERALIEKQNLLNTMQVPLMVVDPNSDEIVTSNKAADALGIRRGARFADRVSNDPRAREHYARMQSATSEPRRAYGVPIRVQDEDASEREVFAIVRSVAVTAPIEALEADERHRLGILFLIDRDSDLGLIVSDVEQTAHRDERRRLAGLLSHGLDALVSVLERSLSTPASPDLSVWLAGYLERRLHVTAWLLDHWDAASPTHTAIVDAEQARETLASLERVFAEVRSDAGLRSRLGWSNGPLSQATSEPPFGVDMDWPADFAMTLPIRGGFGFFLTEALSNAMRHGVPGSHAEVVVRCDRVRSELAVEITNARRLDTRAGEGRTYGGLSLLAGMARLFGWREFEARPDSNVFRVSWRAPLTRRDVPGEPD